MKTVKEASHREQKDSSRLDRDLSKGTNAQTATSPGVQSDDNSTSNLSPSAMEKKWLTSNFPQIAFRYNPRSGYRPVVELRRFGKMICSALKSRNPNPNFTWKHLCPKYFNKHDSFGVANHDDWRAAESALCSILIPAAAVSMQRSEAKIESLLGSLWWNHRDKETDEMNSGRPENIWRHQRLNGPNEANERPTVATSSSNSDEVQDSCLDATAFTHDKSPFPRKFMGFGLVLGRRFLLALGFSESEVKKFAEVATDKEKHLEKDIEKYGNMNVQHTPLNQPVHQQDLPKRTFNKLVPQTPNVALPSSSNEGGSRTGFAAQLTTEPTLSSRKRKVSTVHETEHVAGNLANRRMQQSLQGRTLQIPPDTMMQMPIPPQVAHARVPFFAEHTSNHGLHSPSLSSAVHQANLALNLHHQATVHRANMLQRQHAAISPFFAGSQAVIGEHGYGFSHLPHTNPVPHLESSTATLRQHTQPHLAMNPYNLNLPWNWMQSGLSPSITGNSSQYYRNYTPALWHAAQEPASKRPKQEFQNSPSVIQKPGAGNTSTTEEKSRKANQRIDHIRESEET